MQRQQVALFVQGLRGVQASVVLVYLSLRCALTLAELCDMTGESYLRLSAAVKGLVSKGMLVGQRGEHGRMSYLPVMDSFTGYFGGEWRALEQQNLENRDSAVVVVDESIGENIPLPFQQKQQQQACQNLDFRDSGRRKPDKVLWSATYQKSEAEVEECRKVLDECGIHGRKAARLACLDWVNPEYIRGHVAAVLGDGVAWDNPLGMAITRIEEHYPLEALRTSGHLAACICTRCKAVDKAAAGDKYSHSAFDLYLTGAPTGDPDDSELMP